MHLEISKYVINSLCGGHSIIVTTSFIHMECMYLTAQAAINR